MGAGDTDGLQILKNIIYRGAYAGVFRAAPGTGASNSKEGTGEEA